MNKVFPRWKPEKYHHFVRVLAFIAEQKVATGKQVEKYCFHSSSRSLAWDTLKKLRSAQFVDTMTMLEPTERPYSAFYLTAEGFKELKLQSLLDLGEIQIKSNTPKHDVILTDLRLHFSRIQQCHYFVPENIIRSKILEDDVNEIAIFRSNRCDSAVFMTINDQKAWLALEYERSRKSQARYIQRFKNWYQAENLRGVLLVAENDSLIEVMTKIDAGTLPHLPRKILYLSIHNLQSATNEIKFFNSEMAPLTFTIGKSPNIQYPILDHNFAKSRSSL